MRRIMVFLLVLAAPAAGAPPALAGPTGSDIPYFARKYNVACAQCHVLPPKLNAFGQAFLERGYALPGEEPEGTWPFAIWLSGRMDGLRTAETRSLVSYINRLELVSGGEIVAPWLSYFVEWRPVSFEARPDGTLRDRSGRFEDLFLVASADRFEVMLGQFRQVQQVDVSQRLSLSEPLVLSAALPGTGEGTARERGLRAFSPAMRSPSARVAWTNRLAGGWRLTSAVALPLPGEFSLPLTREARQEASNEIALRPKGVFVESYMRRGLATFGAHAFHDGRGDRWLLNGVTTGVAGRWYWTAMAGLDQASTDAPVRGRWSVEVEYFPSGFAGAGVRVEDRAGDTVPRALLPYVALHFPGTSYTFRLTGEQRLQRGRNATLIEFGTVF